jgi:steroid delta-isomerase
MPDAATIRATVDRYIGQFADRAAFLANFAEGAWIEDPVGTPRHEGIDAIGAFYDQTHGLSAEISLERTGPVRVAGGEAAFPFQARTVLGGGTFVIDIIDVMTFAEDGRIATMRAFWDPAEMRPVDG